ncbi:MAG TPA: NADP-dependent oxidoreductase [Candidatus Limnocylindria bacterium]|nr:NADP-dependent oxidoreductase [Candidatus Limnocylindria bacterium]
MTSSRNAAQNRRIVLAGRPQGAPEPSHFRLESAPVPEPGEGQALLRTLYLSLDPYMRGRMSDRPSYRPPVALGEVMVGGTVSRVVASRHDGFAVGDVVLGFDGWQEYALSDGSGLTKLAPEMTHPSHALGVLGMPGFTAWHGLLTIGAPKPGETVVVAAASGAVGSVVGQLAKMKGCRVIGVAGGSKKCAHVVDDLGFDACIDHRDPGFARKLAAACPNGIDVYFENVGGAVLDAVLPLLNVEARVPVCGLVAQYSDTEPPPGPDRLPLLMNAILMKRIRVQGFIILDHYGEAFEAFVRAMSGLVGDGRVRFFEDVVDGLEHAPEAFIGMLQGRNNGKVVIRFPEG